MRTKLIAAVATTLSIIALICVIVFATGRRHPDQVSLVFQKYGDLFPAGSEALLWLTNASDKSYLVSSPTPEMDYFGGRREISWMVNCEFSDQTPDGWSNWIQQPSPLRRNNSNLALKPHSGIMVKVPLPMNGRHRKAAVLCEVRPTTSISPFWTNSVGFLVFRMLPRSLKNKVLHPQPVFLKVWCDHELWYSGEQFDQK